jgi:hypothetical protein
MEILPPTGEGVRAGGVSEMGFGPFLSEPFGAR